ncbi:MAG: molybdenum cofactor guanylyltransferase MobA [Thiohalophilus sp.]
MNSGIFPEAAPLPPTTGVILAGGLARRMGGHDKGLLEVDGRPMVLHIHAQLQPQVNHLVINANRNQDTYAALTGCEVIRDQIGDFAGPLAGMASALAHCTTPYLVAVPCDSPFVAPDLVVRLHRARRAQQADIALATEGDKLQPVFVLLSCHLLDSLRAFLEAGGRKIIDWYYQHAVVEVDFTDQAEMFENINTPEEQQRIEQRLRQAI